MDLLKPFKWLMGLLSLDLGIDLGTANTLVSIRDRGIVINEPSWVAINKRTRRPLAIGAEAREMVGRTPSDIVAIRPLRDGVISNFDVTARMLRYFFKKVVGTRVLFMDEGKIAEEASPIEFFTNPKNPRARDFLSKVLY